MNREQLEKAVGQMNRKQLQRIHKQMRHKICKSTASTNYLKEDIWLNLYRLDLVELVAKEMALGD